MKTNINEIAIPAKLKLEVVHEFELNLIEGTVRAAHARILLADEPRGPQYLLRNPDGVWLVPTRVGVLDYRTVSLSGVRAFNVVSRDSEAPEWSRVVDVPDAYEVWQIKE